MRAEARDDSTSAVTCVSCQQAAAGVPKCAICEQGEPCHHTLYRCHDDENTLERMTPAATGREEPACGRTLVYLKGPAENSGKTRWSARDSFMVKMH